MSATHDDPVKLALVGGFLGAGKTTLVVEAARQLSRAGRRAAIITNDQGCDLADTEVARANGIATSEVAGGCFCCRFDDLSTAVTTIATNRPDLILAEAVGSCTDLVATVFHPMARLHGDKVRMLPLTIVVDPRRVQGMCSHGPTGFPPEVVYLFEQQIREADVIILSKGDVHDADTVGSARRIVSELNPTALCLQVSALTGEHVRQWVSILDGASGPRSGGASPLVDIDYEKYGAAESMLAWLNATVSVSVPNREKLNELTRTMADLILVGLRARKGVVAHVKVLGTDGEGRISQLNLTTLDRGWQWGGRSAQKVSHAEIIVNARVCTDPDDLESLVRRAVKDAQEAISGRTTIRQLVCFRPSAPVPLHRDAVTA